MADSPRRNWFFTLLIPAAAAFAITAVALAVIPVIEERAALAGNTTPTTGLRASLRENGWYWLLVETGVVIALSIAAMTWDWLKPDRETRRQGDKET